MITPMPTLPSFCFRGPVRFTLTIGRMPERLDDVSKPRTEVSVAGFQNWAESVSFAAMPANAVPRPSALCSRMPKPPAEAWPAMAAAMTTKAAEPINRAW